MDFIIKDIGEMFRNPCYECREGVKEKCSKEFPIPHSDCKVGHKIAGIILLAFTPAILFGQVIYYGIKLRKET